MHSFKERLLESLRGGNNENLSRDFAPWLLDDITAPIWHMQFGKSKCSIDWRVSLGSHLLTDVPHVGLLHTFKSWLLVQTHPICSGRNRPSQGQVAYNKVTQVIRHIDYFLLNSAELGLAEHGLRAITSNDMLNMLLGFEKYSSDEAGVYDWNTHLSRYLLKHGDQLSAFQIEQACDEMPLIENIELAEEEWKLLLTRDQLVRGRAYLWLNGFYKTEKRLGYEYTPKTVSLACEIYEHTLWGRSKKSIHEELCIGRFESHQREYPGVDVRTSTGDAGSEQSFSVRKKSLLTLSVLAKFGCEVPLNSIAQATKDWSTDEGTLRLPGRFKHPPFWEVINTFRAGTEFALRHGEHLVASYHNVVHAAHKANCTVSSFVLQHDVRELLMPGTLMLGTKVWALKTKIALPRGYPIPNAKVSARALNAEYFTRLRKNEGLIDLLEVLCGSIQHNVGAITARRQSELRNLPAHGALDVTRRFLLFGNAKSGYEGKQEKEFRPIPKLGSDLISILENLHSGMPKLDSAKAFLFSLPGERGMLVHHICAYNGALDSLCDYFETPIDENNRRLYIRQHQLRKFFVVAFFYGSTNASVDVLRWFLGHVDAEHLWHYITSEIPGEMLRSIKATFVTDDLQERSVKAQGQPHLQFAAGARDLLENLVFERFGTKSFKLIDGEALTGYIDVLLKRGFDVVPDFYYGATGKGYVMSVTVEKGSNL